MNKTDVKTTFTTKNFKMDFREDEDLDPNLLQKHCHLSYEIFLFYEGEVNYVIESNSYPLRPYNLLILKPSIFHFAQLLSGKNYKRNVIHFEPNLLSPENNARLQNTPNIVSVSADHPIVNFLESTAVLLRTLKKSQKIEVTQYIPTHLTNLITTFCKELSADENATLPIISKIVGYINNNLTNPHTLDTLAEELFFNKYYISHIFKKHMGISVMDYIRQKRILYAQSLIENGATAKEASELAGFSNYTTFYRGYKQFFNKVPSDNE